MAKRLLSLLIGAFLIAALQVGTAHAAKRIALVVGNDSYQSVTPLQKAVNDARAVSAALEEIGFSVIRGENLTRRDMNRRLSELDGSIAPGDTVLFFFAGHGVAIGAENFLLSTDMPRLREGEEGLVQDEAHSVDDIIRRIQGRGAAVSFVMLDACRDNPFAATGARNIGFARGLAQVEAPSGVFVLYSAGIGQTALDRLGEDDADPNSVFTRKLVPLLRTEGLSHVALAKRVQREVDTLAQTIRHSQQPAYYDQIVGEIVLKPAGEAQPASQQSEAAAAWAAVERTTSLAVLEAYIARYRGSVFADLAAARLGELRGATAGSTDGEAPAAADPLSRAIQVEMRRVGCFSGEPDGRWTAESVEALGEFSAAAGIKIAAAQPDDKALEVLKASSLVGCSAGPEKQASPEKKTSASQKKTSTGAKKSRKQATSKSTASSPAPVVKAKPKTKTKAVKSTAAAKSVTAGATATKSRKRKLPSCDSIATLPGGPLGKRQQKRLGNCE